MFSTIYKVMISQVELAFVEMFGPEQFNFLPLPGSYLENSLNCHNRVHASVIASSTLVT